MGKSLFTKADESDRRQVAFARIRLALLAIFTVSLGASCTTQTLQAVVPEPPSLRPLRSLRPVVAVTEFENQAGFSGQWHLGNGMADVLSTKLLQSERVIVLDRRNLQDVLSELAHQSQDLFRREGRAERGRLMNARYLLRGVITDFTVIGDTSGWFGSTYLRSWLRSQRSRVAVNIKISDVQTGEILASVRADGTASAGWFGAKVDYEKMTFGGDTFYQTPLGRATEQAAGRAVRRILDSLPIEYWEPRVADVDGLSVLLNGGENVDLRLGTEFIVRGEPRSITDPIRGDVIDQIPGAVLGRIKITQVRPASSLGQLIEGRAMRGAYLETIR